MTCFRSSCCDANVVEIETAIGRYWFKCSECGEMCEVVREC